MHAGIVQSNLCWKIHNKYVFRVNIHIFVLKYLVQIQIIQNQFKISEGGKWNGHQMRVYTVQEWLQITVFVLLEKKMPMKNKACIVDIKKHPEKILKTTIYRL
jgi:hypothetical protein